MSDAKKTRMRGVALDGGAVMRGVRVEDYGGFAGFELRFGEELHGPCERHVQIAEATGEDDVRLSARVVREEGQLICSFHFEAPC